MTISKKVAVTVDGEEFTLTMNFAALCAIEEEVDAPFPLIIAGMQSGNARLSTVVAMFRAALLKERPGVTREEAINLIDQIGPERATQLVADALEQSTMLQGRGPKARKPA